MCEASESQVDIFDDFEDAEEMLSSFCTRVSEREFEEQTRTATDAALGELCTYLDRNPEIYARILRKRKQEEMESSGVISFVKSKMMSILHGESLPQCLVSVAECRKQTEALKLGMCKTFQYSQELTGRSTRQSERLAAKRRAKLDQGESSSANIGQMENFSDLHQTCVNFKGNAGSPSKPSSAAAQPSPPHPPPAPPLPPLLTSQVKSCHSPDVSARVTRATVLVSVNNTQLTAVDNNGNPAGGKKASTPSEQVCKAENQENDSANFVTPMLTKRMLRHKRSSSNSSTGSNSSQLSLANVHLELKSSNPLTRLRSTQVNRSPGGTPVRVPGEYQPTEPLHKALLSAMKAKFKNVSTPSPGRRSAAGSGRASATSSVSTSANNSSFGLAQSP